jgi:SAM-dependent methyltransferase
MRIPERVKRPFREHPVTRRSYTALARRVSLAQAFLYERLGRHYYSAAFFDRVYSECCDLWRYAGNPHSEERRARILAILPRTCYRQLLEIGCAEGWMTASLVERAVSLLSVDISEVALRRARERLANTPNVRFARLDLLQDPIPGTFDGIVCTSVLVYLPRSAQERVRDEIVAVLAPSGDLLLENEREPHLAEVPGLEVHTLYGHHQALKVVAHEERSTYTITLFRKTSH